MSTLNNVFKMNFNYKVEEVYDELKNDPLNH